MPTKLKPITRCHRMELVLPLKTKLLKLVMQPQSYNPRANCICGPHKGITCIIGRGVLNHRSIIEYVKNIHSNRIMLPVAPRFGQAPVRNQHIWHFLIWNPHLWIKPYGLDRKGFRIGPTGIIAHKQSGRHVPGKSHVHIEFRWPFGCIASGSKLIFFVQDIIGIPDGV